MRHRRPAPLARDRARPPEERSLTDARYIGSYPRADVVLSPRLPEVALIGRSNVGKSSLLNALAGARIARVSGTPGKTRMMNVYEMQLGRGERGEVRSAASLESGVHRQVPLPSPLSLYALDLPGYGYARAGKTERAAFRRLVEGTLHRPLLTGALWLLDVRRDPSPDDRTMHELFAAHATRVLAALTKSDKLSRSERLRREGELLATLALDREQVITTSAVANEGIDELRQAIAGLVGRSPGVS